MHTDDYLIECKTVLEGKRQITIKEDDLRQLVRNAAIAGIVPMLHVRLGGVDWVMLPEVDFTEGHTDGTN